MAPVETEFAGQELHSANPAVGLKLEAGHAEQLFPPNPTLQVCPRTGSLIQPFREMQLLADV